MSFDRIILFPYYLSLKLRDRYYSSEKRKLFKPAVPCVCVGNVTVGGTGKTPFVEMILRLLQESSRWRDSQLAVLSRGYKRESKGFQQVVCNGSSSMFGDEPLQIKKKFPAVTVAVDKNRVEACKFLCDPASLQSSSKKAVQCWDPDFPKSDFIVLDDAFQYRKLRSDLSVVLINSLRPVNKDCLLPLGKLRDLKERIYSADVLVVTKCSPDMDDEQKREFAASLSLMNYDPHTCTCFALASGGAAGGASASDAGVGSASDAVSVSSAVGSVSASSSKPSLRAIKLFFTSIAYLPLERAFPSTEPRYIYSKKAILLSGIESDTALRNYLSDSYKIVARLRFPDHHKYEWSDINRLQSILRKNPTASIITTEKDVQRLLDFKGMPEEIMERCFYAPIETRFVSAHEQLIFSSLLDAL